MNANEEGDILIDLNFYSRFVRSGFWSIKLNLSILAGKLRFKKSSCRL